MTNMEKIMRVINNEPLTEAEGDTVEITLSGDQLMNPSSINLKDIAAKEIADKKAAEEKAAEEAKKAELAAQGAQLYGQITDKNNIESWFDVLVPASGKADTAAGEAIRAMMRILYRYYNDGDVFYEGYGLETAGPSMEYLMDCGYFNLDWEELEDKIADFIGNEIKYEKFIKTLSRDLLEYLEEHQELLATENKEDSRDYTTEALERIQPKYDYEIYASDDVANLLDNHIVDAWDCIKYLEDLGYIDNRLNNIEVDRPWGHYSKHFNISGLTKEQYDIIDDMFSRNPDRFWEDFVQDYADELDVEDDDEDEEFEESFDDDYYAEYTTVSESPDLEYDDNFHVEPDEKLNGTIDKDQMYKIKHLKRGEIVKIPVNPDAFGFDTIVVKLNDRYPEYYHIWSENSESGEVANETKFSSLENIIYWANKKD